MDVGLDLNPPAKTQMFSAMLFTGNEASVHRKTSTLISFLEVSTRLQKPRESKEICQETSGFLVHGFHARGRSIWAAGSNYRSITMRIWFGVIIVGFIWHHQCREP